MTENLKIGSKEKDIERYPDPSCLDAVMTALIKLIVMLLTM